jgi:hypothetical protein
MSYVQQRVDVSVLESSQRSRKATQQLKAKAGFRGFRATRGFKSDSDGIGISSIAFDKSKQLRRPTDVKVVLWPLCKFGQIEKQIF